MTSKNTDELMHLLNETKNCAQLQTYTAALAQQAPLQSFSEYINSKMNEQNLSAAELIDRKSVV